MMKRWMLVGLIVLILLGAFFVQAQRECSENLSRGECNLYESALDNLHDRGDMYFYYTLNTTVHLQTNQIRWISLTGSGTLERNRSGEVDWLGLDGHIVAGIRDRFHPASLQPFTSSIGLVFEENEVSFSRNDEDGLRYLTNLEALEIESFFPSLDLEISELFVEPLDSRSTMIQFSFNSAHVDSPFMPFFTFMLGDEAAESGFYEGSILIDTREEAIIGAAFHAIEFLDGESFGQAFPVRRTSEFTVNFVSSELPVNIDFDVEDELEDEANRFEDAAEYSPWAMLLETVREPLEEIFPPISNNPALSGGLDIGSMGNSPTATPYLTPTPYPTFTPIPLTPNADGYPCYASIIESDESFLDVVHNSPDPDSPVPRFVRPEQEIVIEESVEAEDGRWYRLSFNGMPYGYIQEEYVVLGEECPP